jgi:hypothetical protein
MKEAPQTQEREKKREREKPHRSANSKDLTQDTTNIEENWCCACSGKNKQQLN